MVYRNAKQQDVEEIMALARSEAGLLLSAEKIRDDLEHFPHEVAENVEGLRGFVLSEELSPDILLVHYLIINENEKSNTTGRALLELIESKAADRGYCSIMVSGFVENFLHGCQDERMTFAGYTKIHDTGGSRLLIKRIK